MGVTRFSAIFLMLFLISGCATTQRTARYADYRTYQALRMENIQTTNVTPSNTGTNIACHTVKPGETLWSISKMYNVDLENLAAANSISDYSSVAKGSVLVIPKAQKSRAKPMASVYAKNDSFTWPVRGNVVYRFGENINGGVNKGIDISAPQGRDVVAARAGRIVYCDSFLKGFGQTLILDHADGYQTVYSYNSDILVKVGDTVRQNQIIAKVGQSGRAKEPMLHFEIRRNGEAQDPERFLR